MRTIHVVLSAGCVLMGCSPNAEGEGAGTQPEHNAIVAAAAEQPAPPRAAAAPAARLGGAIVGTGEYAVEVMASATGSVDAALMTATGEAVPNADVKDLKVTMQGQGKARHEIALSWDAPRGVFHGMAAADARLASGPLDVSFAIGDRTHQGRLELAVVVPRPRFGGRMIVAGQYAAEVVPKIDGEVEVHVLDATGAALKGAADLDLKLRAQAEAGATREIALRWHAPRARFVGKLEGDAKLAPGPIELAVRAGQVAAQGRIEFAALVAPPSLGGNVIAAGDYTIEIAPQLDGQIDAVVRNAAGVAVEGGVDLQARVQAGGELRTVALNWDAALARFRGKLEGDFQIEPGPIELSLVAQGRLRQGAIMAAVVLPKPALDAKADVKAKLASRAELKAKAKADAALAARMKAEAAAAQKAQAKAKAELAALQGGAKLDVRVPQPSASLKAGASGTADAKAGAAAQTTTKTSARTTGTAKQQAGVKVGGSFSLGAN